MLDGRDSRAETCVMDEGGATVLVIIPGFGLGKEDYAGVAASSGTDRQVVFDVWPHSAEEVMKIGMPKSESHEAWTNAKTDECAALLRAVAVDDQGAPTRRVIIFSHSFGSEFVRRLGAPAICFGSRPLSTAVAHIRGQHDKLVEPQEGDIVLDCGHFGCVSASAYQRACELQDALGAPRATEEHKDVSDEVGAIIAREARRPDAAVKLAELPGPTGQLR